LSFRANFFRVREAVKDGPPKDGQARQAGGGACRATFGI